jgi:hypothetical protein
MSGRGDRHPILGIFPTCCARDASGHVMAEPATNLMKSRRRISAPRLRATPLITSGICDERNGVQRLRSNNSNRLMSALGQKQTSRDFRAMSALPPKADIAECDHHVRFVPKADILHCSNNAGLLGQVLPNFSPAVCIAQQQHHGCAPSALSSSFAAIN